jgi:hypothetical protein
VPRYFFHLHQSETDVSDDEGLKLEDLDDAMKEACEAILDIAGNAIKAGSRFDLVGIRICDGDGSLLAEVFSRDVLAKVISPAVMAL